MLTPAELAEYAHVMKAEGISSFQGDGISITLHPGAFFPIGGSSPSPPPREYTDEELLFAATEGLPT
jgi:hypothetical protein